MRIEFISRACCYERIERCRSTDSNQTFPILNKLNYQVWASRMRLTLEVLELWDAIEFENVVRKKDQQVTLILFSTISDEVTQELDVEKTAK